MDDGHSRRVDDSWFGFGSAQTHLGHRHTHQYPLIIPNSPFSPRWVVYCNPYTYGTWTQRTLKLSSLVYYWVGRDLPLSYLLILIVIITGYITMTVFTDNLTSPLHEHYISLVHNYRHCQEAGRVRYLNAIHRLFESYTTSESIHSLPRPPHYRTGPSSD